jgi:hypothetical protein
MRRFEVLLTLGAIAIGPEVLVAQDVAPWNGAYEALNIPPDSVGTCETAATNSTMGQRKPNILAFHASKAGHDRFVQLSERTSTHLTVYEELVGGRQGDVSTLRGVVGRVDSAGTVTGFSQSGGNGGSKQPTTRPLTLAELKRIPLLINWIQRRCGGSGGKDPNNE